MKRKLLEVRSELGGGHAQRQHRRAHVAQQGSSYFRRFNSVVVPDPEPCCSMEPSPSPNTSTAFTPCRRACQRVEQTLRFGEVPAGAGRRPQQRQRHRAGIKATYPHKPWVWFGLMPTPFTRLHYAQRQRAACPWQPPWPGQRQRNVPEPETGFSWRRLGPGQARPCRPPGVRGGARPREQGKMPSSSSYQEL
jgi:hypothetical protein